MCALRRLGARVGGLLLPLLLLAVLPAESAAQLPQVFGSQPQFHSQIPPGDSLAGGNFQWFEPGIPPCPNGYCTCACIDMLFNYFEYADHDSVNPWPQREIAAAANTNDSLGTDGHYGTWLSDARRAVHFSSNTPSWPNTPPSYLGGVNAPTGYSWRTAGPGGTNYGFVAIDGVWSDLAWTRQMFKAMLAGNWPVMVNIDADSMNASMANGDIGDDRFSSDQGWSAAESVEETAVGHSIVVYGYISWGGAIPDSFRFNCPTFGPGKTVEENEFWNSWWVNKDFLFVVPWTTDIDVPVLGSFNPNAFDITGTGNYRDALPIAGTADCDSIMGAIWFYGDDPVAALATDEKDTIKFADVTLSGTSTDGDWSCVTKKYGSSPIQVESWAVISMTSDSYSAGYEDFIGAVSDTDTIRVPTPEVAWVDPSICNIPRGAWWVGHHVSVWPGNFSPGAPNDISVEVENRGTLVAEGFHVEVMAGDPTLVQFLGDPLMVPLGMVILPPIVPGGSVTSTPVFFSAPTGNSFGQPYYNFFTVCGGPGDPIHAEWVEIENNIACRSVHDVQLEPYQGTFIEFHVGNPYPFECWVEVVVEASMPGDWSCFLGPAGMERVLMAPGDMQTRTLFVTAGSPWASTFEVREDIYDADNHFIRCTGGLQFRVSTLSTGTPDDDVTRVTLLPCMPNPAARGAEIAFAVPAPAHAKLAVYDPSGRLVAVVHDGPAPAGWTRVAWDGLGTKGERVASGVYFARLTALGEERTAKLVMLR